MAPTPDKLPADPAAAAEQRLEEQTGEYETYVAIAPITIGGVRAFNKGDAVPTSHVDRKVVDKDLVATRDSAAGKAALGQES